MNFLTWFQTNQEQIVQIATAVVTICSVVARITPTEVDNQIVNSALKFINLIALTKPAQKKDNIDEENK